MKVIIKNNNIYSLVNIPSEELENTINCNEEIIRDFIISENDFQLIERGAKFEYVNGNINILEMPIGFLGEEKDILISNFKEIEKQATNKRAEYLTAELLPDGEFKTIKLTKLFNEGEEIKTQYENKMQELIQKYGESILNELI